MISNWEILKSGKSKKNREKLRKKNRNKSGTNPEQIRKPDEIPENKIIISHLRIELSYLWKNMVTIAEIWRFEKFPQEKLRNKTKQKKISKLRSFAQEVKGFWCTEANLEYWNRNKGIPRTAKLYNLLSNKKIIPRLKNSLL